jgi:hypothetical protein
MKKIKIVIFKKFAGSLPGCVSLGEGNDPVALITRLSLQNVLPYKTNILSNSRIEGANPGAWH